MEQAGVERRPVAAQRVRPARAERRIGRDGARRGPLPAEVAVDHRHGAVDEVPEVVGEVRVVAPAERVPADLGVTVEGDLAQGRVARAVGAERGHDRLRLEEVAEALAHPLAARHEQPAVDPDVLRRLDPGRPQHGRPVDRVEAGDVLADDVQVGRPPALERLEVVGVAGPGDVVDQGVVPDVDRARLRVPRAVLALRGLAVLRDRERDAPGGAGAADREVLEALADEPQHLVAAVVGLHEVGVRLVPRRAAGPGRPRGGRTSCAR